MAMTDGLLGWPGLGQSGSLEWKIIRLYTGDVWYAPKSGWYLFWGAGGGGGAPNLTACSGGGSGATLFGFPLYVPESAGGQVTLGSGGGVGGAGTATSLGDILILGGGDPGVVSGAGGLSGSISGWLVTARGSPLASQGTAGDATGTNIQPSGGDGGFNSSALTGDLVSDLLNGRIKIANGGVINGPGPQSVGAGGAQNQAGAGGGLIIAYV